MVGVMKDWKIIFKVDIDKTNELQKEYEALLKKCEALKKVSITEKKRKKIDKLLVDIKIKLDKVKQIDEKQVKLLLSYCGNSSVQSLT